MGSLHRASDRNQIIRRLMDLQPDDQPHWGHLSPTKLLAHFRDSFALSSGLKPNISPGTGFFSTAFGKWIVISSPLPWPKGLKVPDLFFETVATTFDADRSLVIHEIERYAEDPNTLEWGISPEFGRLTAKQWGRLNFRHCAHHLKQFGR